MTDKRTDSSHPSAHPPLPSIAPPTDDIDAEWGADEIPAAAKVPQVVAPSAPAPAPAPAPALSIPAASSPLRKQTLLGMAPVVAPRVEPQAAAAPVAGSEPPRPSSAKSEPPRALLSAAIPAASNRLHKQTLLGIAPVVPVRAEPPASPEPAAQASPEPVANPAQPTTSVVALEAEPAVAADAVASDAPITRELAGKSSRPRAPRSAPSVLDTDDLPELRSRRPRWLVPVAAAALIGLGVVGLRALDRPPTPLAPMPPRPAAKAATLQAPDSEEADSDPEPTALGDPEALKAAATAPAAAAPTIEPSPAAVAASPAGATSAPAPSAEAAASEVASGETKSVNVTSEPTGARMFWKGKEVGTTPFVLEIPAGQRRSYELGRQGFVTRKVVIDGSKSDIAIGLKPKL